MSPVEAPPEPTRTSKRPPTWQLAVTVIMIVFLGAQLFAGWKFLNGRSYPIVGSAMFNGPPTPESADFLVPRVLGTTVTGENIEMDQHTFELEPFEWRAWIIRNLEHVSQEAADAAGVTLAEAYTGQTGETLASLEVWRIPALTDDFDPSHLVRTVDL